MNIARLCIACLLLGLSARCEIVTLFQSGSPPHASSAAYTNTYSLGIVDFGSLPPTNATWSVMIRSNEVCRLIGHSGNFAMVLVRWRVGIEDGYYSTVNQMPLSIAFVGPGTISAGQQNITNGFATFQISRADEFVGPQNTLAIPSDAAGPVYVKMESSTNLLDWTASNPGFYGTSSALRFFRIRAEIGP